MSSYSRQDVLRILQISARQLQGWEKAGLIPCQQAYSFQDLGQLKTLRSLREEDVPAASIRHSITAMRAVAGMTNPLLESTVVRTGSRIAFRHHGAMVDPIRRQLLFDFERAGQKDAAADAEPLCLPLSDYRPNLQEAFLAAVRAEEAGEKQRAMELYEALIAAEPGYAPAYINLGTIHFHLRQYTKAEQLYRRATVVDPEYVLAFFDLGNVLDELDRLDESVAAYQKAIALSPRYADAHYNVALAYERQGEHRAALRHWHAYLRLDRNGPWAEHARGQIHKLLAGEALEIAWRTPGFVRRSRPAADLRLTSDRNAGF